MGDAAKGKGHRRESRDLRERFEKAERNDKAEKSDKEDKRLVCSEIGSWSKRDSEFCDRRSVYGVLLVFVLYCLSSYQIKL